MSGKEETSDGKDSEDEKTEENDGPEAENNEAGEDEQEAGEDTGKPVAGPGSLLNRLRRIFLIIAIVTITAGVLMVYFEDIAQLVMNGGASSLEESIMEILMADGSVNNFMSSSTEVQTDISSFRRDEASLIFKQMESDCDMTGKDSEDLEEVYRIIIEDEHQNISSVSLVAWVDLKEEKLLCVSRKGNWSRICTTHASSGCIGNDLYWYDSCSAVEGIKQSCFGACSDNECVPVCIGENVISEYSRNLSCCGSLSEIPYANESGEDECIVFNGSFACTKCGDGLCQIPENRCNCQEDCTPVCTDYDGLDYEEKNRAVKGDVEKWDECEGGKLLEYYCEYNIIKSEAYECPEDYECYFGRCVYMNIPCVEEGDIGMEEPGYECCEGLDRAYVRTRENECKQVAGVFICINCGNGACGPGETCCNCPEDCGGSVNCTITE